MKKYDNYKDSGVEWIGKIPEHWDVKKLKFISKICNGQDQKAVIDDNGIYPIYGSGGIFGKAKSFLFDQPSVLLGRKGTIDKPQYVVEPFWTVDTSYYTKIKDGFSTRLFYYLCTTINFELYKYGSAIPSMTQGHLNEIKFSIPNTLDEQTAIANYLDHKTTQIDTLIAKKEQFISLLQEERTAVINQAVTKGLDPKVKMKDSGIEWLGEIPEHWEVKKLKFVSKITRGAILRPVDEPSYFDDNGEWTYLNISDATICDKYLDYGKLRLSELGSTKSARVEPNNLIITASATIGKPFINKIPVCVHDGFIPITELKVNIDFLYNYFKNPQLFNGLGKSNTQKNIYLEDVKNLIIPIPNLEEQLLIARYIEEEIIRIETLISKSLQEIELLKEYKTALISEVVTGKVDVRDEVLN